MSNALPYTLTHESVMVVWNGKPYTVQNGAPNYNILRQAVLKAISTDDWSKVPECLTVTKSIKEWAKGKFTMSDDGAKFFYEGAELPHDINKRIVSMATAGEDPTGFLKFWERLQKNPSYRSVQQLYTFLQHEGIPITADGCFLAYKSVRRDYKDVHSGTVDNKPGVTNEMPRNKISDDPNEACHEGFHVGAMGYVRTFHSGGIIVICKVAPEDVVCVPYDHHQHKMRVCKYTVMGHHSGENLSSTTHSEDTYDLEEKIPTHEANEEEDDGPGEYDEIEPEDNEETGDKKSEETAPSPSAPEVQIDVEKKYQKYLSMDTKALMDVSLADLRNYATYGLKIVGASKIAGGKSSLVSRILDVQAKVAKTDG